MESAVATCASSAEKILKLLEASKTFVGLLAFDAAVEIKPYREDTPTNMPSARIRYRQSPVHLLLDGTLWPTDGSGVQTVVMYEFEGITKCFSFGGPFESEDGAKAILSAAIPLMTGNCPEINRGLSRILELHAREAWKRPGGINEKR